MNPKEARYQKTLDFIRSSQLTNESRILDLGVPNELSKRISELGFQVSNTGGEDLDLDQSALAKEYDAVTAFEILEHTLNPFTILRSIHANHLIVSIPLKLWFASAYRSKSDPWDRHYHEFEDWQFDWLLEKTGWKIVRREKWSSPVKKIGIRPILRRFTPRYYIVEAVRAS